MTVERQVVTLEQRRSLLEAIPGLDELPGEFLDELAKELREEEFPAGSAVVVEGEAGDRLVVVVDGRAEAAVAGPNGLAPVASLVKGEYFGEIALLSEHGLREATVTALTELSILSLSRTAFGRLLDAHPEARRALRAAADTLLVVKFLKVASPFGELDHVALTELSTHLEQVTVAEGETVVTQGEPGDACYLLVHGSVEVLLEHERQEPRRLATLERGAIFGEAALLTETPRNATVRAVEPCDLLRLRRDELMNIAIGEEGVRRELLESVRLRGRPRRVEGVLEYERVDSFGETITVLKDPARGKYFQLSPEGRFIWSKLDGTKTLNDLVIDYWDEYRSIAPHVVVELVDRLLIAGFAALPSPSDELLASDELPLRSRTLLHVRGLAEWYVPVRGVDGVVTRLYRAGGWVLFTTAGQLLLGLIALAGITAFAYESTQSPLSGNAPVLLFLVPALYAATFVHELGHALTTKAFGREVAAAGFGWYWFGPVLYVDTSDMWLAGKRPRMAVGAAGPYTNVVIGSSAALIMLVLNGGAVEATLWEFALMSYLVAVINLNPLLELDGCHILMDRLERPNLRRKALDWLGHDLAPAISGRQRKELREHWFDIVYGLSSVAYIVVMMVASIIFFRLVVQHRLAAIVPDEVAAAGAWVFAALVVVPGIAATIGELRGRAASAN